MADGLGVVWYRGGVEDLVRGGEDAAAGGVDDVGDGGAVRVVGERLFCPAGDVGEGVLAAVEAVGGGDEVGDGFGFDLETAPTDRICVGGGLVE